MKIMVFEVLETSLTPVDRCLKVYFVEELLAKHVLTRTPFSDFLIKCVTVNNHAIKIISHALEEA
jgi:hypothetical protein